MFFDPIYFLFIAPGFLLALFASFYTRSTFEKYSQRRSANGLTGAEAAARLLSSSGIRDVRIEQTQGFLSDHYDPSSKTLRLSPEVYGSDSLSAIGVACHEAGHALQHASVYLPLHFRSMMVPALNICSPLSYILIFAGFFLMSQQLVLIGAILFGAMVLFSIITLPVEWDASARAKKMMVSCGIVSPQESAGAGQVLNAAFLTYVASAVTSLLTLLYYLYRAGLLGGRRD